MYSGCVRAKYICQNTFEMHFNGSHLFLVGKRFLENYHFNWSKIWFLYVNSSSEFESKVNFWKEPTIFLKSIKNRSILHSAPIISGTRQDSKKPSGPGEREGQLTLSDKVSPKFDLRFARYLISALSIVKLSIRADPHFLKTHYKSPVGNFIR